MSDSTAPKNSAIWTYVTAGSDGLAADRALRTDNPDAVRIQDQKRDAGLELWRSWALRVGGTLVSEEPPRVRVPAGALLELEELAEQYAKTLDSRVVVGVGTKLGDADKSFKAAKKEGGGIRLYGKDVEESLRQEEDPSVIPYTESGLNKAQPPGLNPPSAGGGIVTPQQPGNTAPEAPAGEASEHSENESLQALIGAQPDLHAQLGGMADQQQAQDDQSQQEQAEKEGEAQKGGLKEQVVKVLNVFRNQAQQLESLKDQDPELYQGLVDAVQALIEMSRVQFGSAEQNHGEDENHGEETEGEPVQKAEGDNVVPLNPPQGPVKQRRSNAEVVPLATAANTRYEGERQVVDPTARERARVGAVPEFTEPVLAARGVGRGANVYDYSHLAPNEDYSVAVVHTPGVADDYMHGVVLRQGQQVASGWGYPHSTPTTSGSDPQAMDALTEALLNHSHWTRFGLKKAITPEDIARLPDQDQVMWDAALEAGAKPTHHDPAVNPAAHVTAPAKRGGFEGSIFNRINNSWAQGAPTRTTPHTAIDLDAPAGEQERASHAPEPYVEQAANEAALAAAANVPVPPDSVYLVPGMREHGLSDPPTVASAKTMENKFWRGVGRESGIKRSPILKKKLGKAALEAGKTGRHNVVLPVGSQKDSAPNGTREVGKIKVAGPDGKTRWRSVRAGLVMSPDGTPTSSRNPSGSE